MRTITMQEVTNAAISVSRSLNNLFGRRIKVYAIPRGGVNAFMALEKWVSHPMTMVDDPNEADLILDDLYDSGATMSRIDGMLKRKPGEALPLRAVLFSKAPGLRASCFVGEDINPTEWVVFPWEATAEHSAEDIPIRLLQYIGENPTRGGLLETPARFLKAWKEYSRGYTMSAADILKVFEDGAEHCDEMVLVKSIPVYSHCEHHLAPFFGVAHVSYIPSGKIVGLSKLSRLVDMFSKRLQVQERLTNQIADALEEHLQPLGVGVVIECRHMCMESRGIQRIGSTTVTSAMRGAMRTDVSARAELLALVKG